MPNTRTAGIVTAALALWVWAACGESTGPAGAPAQSLISQPTRVVVHFGQEVQVEGSVLRLSFVRVLEDSRCPADVTCVWEGNARVEVGIAAGMGPTFPLQLNTAIAPKFAEWRGVRVTLLDVRPYPTSRQPIPSDEYTIELEVAPAS